MMSGDQVAGLFNASFSVRYSTRTTVNEGTAIFYEPTPEGVEEGQIYPAELIPVRRFRSIISRRRGHHSQLDLGAMSGYTGTSMVEGQGQEHPDFLASSQIYRALGGQALYLAFFDWPANSNRTFDARIVPLEHFPQAASGYFKTLRLQSAYTLRHAAKELGMPGSHTALLKFERDDARQPHIATVARYFSLFEMEVAYCGIRPLPR